MACEWCSGCAGRSCPCSCSDVRPSAPLQTLPRERSLPWAPVGFLCCMPKERESISKMCLVSSTGRVRGSGRTSKCRTCPAPDPHGLVARADHGRPLLLRDAEYTKGVTGHRPLSLYPPIDRRGQLSCPSWSVDPRVGRITRCRRCRGTLPG